MLVQLNRIPHSSQSWSEVRVPTLAREALEPVEAAVEVCSSSRAEEK